MFECLLNRWFPNVIHFMGIRELRNNVVDTQRPVPGLHEVVDRFHRFLRHFYLKKILRSIKKIFIRSITKWNNLFTFVANARWTIDLKNSITLSFLPWYYCLNNILIQEANNWQKFDLLGYVHVNKLFSQLILSHFDRKIIVKWKFYDEEFINLLLFNKIYLLINYLFNFNQIFFQSFWVTGRFALCELWKPPMRKFIQKIFVVKIFPFFYKKKIKNCQRLLGEGVGGINEKSIGLVLLKLQIFYSVPKVTKNLTNFN